MKYQLTAIVFFLLFHTSFVQAQALYNVGKMYVGEATGGSGATLYIQGGMKVGGGNVNIEHKGKTVLTGDFTSEITTGHVFSSRNGVFEFRGDASQKIKGNGANRDVCYIEFPNQVIVNMTTNDYQQSTVVIDTATSVSMDNLEFKKGRMVLDSKSRDLSAPYETTQAHLLVNGITYNHKETAPAENGFVQVNLDLGEITQLIGGLVGFTSPYKALYADYFFFNFLSIPGTSRLFNGDRSDLWVRNPLTKLNPGVGYILGQALVPYTNTTYYNSMLDPQWQGASFSDVIKEKYCFARMLAPASFTQFNTYADRYIGEELNLSDVTVPVTEGYNYLGNPFTAPLDLSSYLDNPASGDFGSFGTDEMENKVYLLGGLSSASYKNEGGKMTFKFTTAFQHVAKVGGTYEGSPLIAPMQMFVVKKKTNTPNSFKIPLSKRTHGKALFLKSAAQEVIDELLIETRDNITGGYDRLCVVFRDDATMKGNHRYDAEKLFNRTGGVNQIYTRSTNNRELITNVVKPDTKQLTMYLMPPNQQQEITLTAKRLNSLKSITSVVIEDHKTGKRTDLMKTSYTFLSSPSDKADRFTLHFSNGLVSTDDIKVTPPLSAYYSSGQVVVQGLTEKALNREAMIYNMQGQLLYKQTVTAVEPLLMKKFLDKGAYIVNVSGEARAIKLWVK
ncbi:MAG: hypothetical protein LBF62_05840 [Tannerellaceae bacterium]|jgi:hypothetical protein|nr:hypothetical protein [Tannerellaceae bacterium]